MPSPKLRTVPAKSRVALVEALLDENEHALIAYASRLLRGDGERARDVVQDAFLRLCRQEDLEGRGREWLFRVTRNLCIDVHRKESRMTTLESGDESPVGAALERAQLDSAQRGAGEADDALGEDDGRRGEGLARAIDRLPDRQQEAIRLKFESGLSYAEIGRIMEISAGTVGWLLHTAIHGLRARLAPEGGVR